VAESLLETLKKASILKRFDGIERVFMQNKKPNSVDHSQI
jgi:hypothetical protein